MAFFLPKRFPSYQGRSANIFPRHINWQGSPLQWGQIWYTYEYLRSLPGSAVSAAVSGLDVVSMICVEDMTFIRMQWCGSYWNYLKFNKNIGKMLNTSSNWAINIPAIWTKSDSILYRLAHLYYSWASRKCDAD